MAIKMIVDVPNLFWRVAAAHNKHYGDTHEDKAGLALHSCILTMNKWYNKVGPDQVIVVFEGMKNWRKAYTASPECISKVPYKGNRVKDPSMEHLGKVLSDFENLARNHTSIVCLSANELEGDDLIAGCAQRFSAEGHDVTVVSGDKDFVQLLILQGLKLPNPDKGDLRTIDDPSFFIFEKCIRGDMGDNVRSAFPNVRKTRLEKAYKDPYEMTLLMNEIWEILDETHPEGKRVMRVGDLYNENKLLMDLTHQPERIRKLIDATIDEGLNNHGKFSLFAFQKFLGQHQLKKLGEDSDKFIKLFSCRGGSNPQKKSVLTF